MTRDPRRLIGEAGWITGRELLVRSAGAPCGTGWRPGAGPPGSPGSSRSRPRLGTGGCALRQRSTGGGRGQSRDRPGPLGADRASSRTGARHRRSAQEPPWLAGRGRAPDARRLRRAPSGRGLPVTAVERAVVDTWGSSAARAGPTRARLRSPPSVGGCAGPRTSRTELARSSTVARTAPSWRSWSRLLADGCQSELEIWGCLHVLRAPGMPTFVQQRRVTVGGETFVLDAACEESMLAVEMDGAAWHGSRQQRERRHPARLAAGDRRLADPSLQLHPPHALARGVPA